MLRKHVGKWVILLSLFVLCINELICVCLLQVDTSLVARRLRKSPYPMVSYADSVVLVDEVVSRVNRSSQEVNVR